MVRSLLKVNFLTNKQKKKKNYSPYLFCIIKFHFGAVFEYFSFCPYSSWLSWGVCLKTKSARYCPKMIFFLYKTSMESNFYFMIFFDVLFSVLFSGKKATNVGLTMVFCFITSPLCKFMQFSVSGRTIECAY